MTRIWYVPAFVGFLVAEVVRGSWRLAASTLGLGTGTTPSIVELPLRCRTDLEVTIMAAAISITPGTLVLGTAPGTESTAPTLFVHSMYGRSRREVVAELGDLESKLLRGTRGRQVVEDAA